MVNAHRLRRVLASNIRAHARRCKMQHSLLADTAGVSRAHFYAVLACTTSPTVDWLAKIGTALHVAVSSLLTPRK